MRRPDRLVILAGGVGSRLRPSGSSKPLVRLGGLSLLERAIAVAADMGFEEVIVVTGHQAERVEQHVREVSARRRVVVRAVHNRRFRDGNGLSALVARPLVGSQPFALVMADHVLSDGIVRRLREQQVGPGEVVVFVDPELGDAAGVEEADAMKVATSGDRVLRIAKDLPVYDAYDIGAFVCTAALFEAIEMAEASGDTSLAGAVQMLADAGRARAVPIRRHDWWFDVDTPRDRRNGQRFLYRHTGKPLDGAIAARINRLFSQRFVTPLLLALFPGITPNQVTLAALAAALVGAVALALGRPLVAAALVALSSVLDGSDGEVARLTRRSSRFGSFLDAVLDRVADSSLFLGAGLYCAAGPLTVSVAGPPTGWLSPVTQAGVAIVVAGTALTGHLLVSYTTAKAGLDLRHRYRGAIVGSGHGRDLRLAVLMVGAAASTLWSGALMAALVLLAVLTWGIVVVRIRASWWAEGDGRGVVGVRAVALDFDGTVADSMGFLTGTAVELLCTRLGFEPDAARLQYLATSGLDFRTQLDELAPGSAHADQIAETFERSKVAWMPECPVFSDVVPFLRQLADLGVPVALCSSTRLEVVESFCRHRGLSSSFTSIYGWEPNRPKARQLAAFSARLGLGPGELLFVGDAARDAAIARRAGARFIGLARPGRPDPFGGTGVPVVGSLTELSRLLHRAAGSPVRFEGGSVPQVQTSEMAGVVQRDQLWPVTDNGDRGDRAVADLNMAVDLRPAPQRPPDRGPNDSVVGEHYGDATVG